MQKNDGYLYLAGIASWVQGCAQLNHPSIFTRVPSYVNALNAIMDGKSSTLNAEPDATAVLPDSGEASSETETSNGGETQPGNTPTGGGSGDGGSGGGALSIACLSLLLLRRRKK